MMAKFDKCLIHQIPREENERADASSKFGAAGVGVKERKVLVFVKEMPTIEEMIHLVEEDRSWKAPYIQNLKNGSLPSDPIAAKRLQFKANMFTLLNEELYKRGPKGLLLKCLNEERARIGIVGPFPPATVQKKFMIVAVEYFSKWEEAKANGQTEVTNRILLQHLKARIARATGSWVEEFAGVLWGYWTTPRSTTGETPFCLVYGSEEVIPAEIREEISRVNQYNQQNNSEDRAFDLSVIEEKRDCAYARILHFKSLMTRSYNQRVKPRSFQVDDLIFKKVEVSKHVGKLDLTWEGPYKVTEIKKKGTYVLQDLEGKDLPRPWNIHNLKKFYA
ncbi:UNVERIFIED_CONTAM: hypothetical protein Sradi_0817300 [Sesamum radiatum]|uniref:Uncharacterized protein n=1 Tax=Sesamum radiatum TaxID=300843 RepID=A0AAW2VRV9_SESRA